MTERRRSYTKRQRAAVVGESEAIGVRPAARKNHVPVSTLQHWRESTDMAQLRTEKREDVAQDVWTAFQLGVRRVVELIPETDDLQKVATATGIIYDKYALIAGQATSRSETMHVTDKMDDHERELLSDILRQAAEVEA